MDPISLIIAALVAGAQEVAGTAIKDVYNELKELIKRKFAGKQAADVALTQYEKNPDAWKTALEAELKEAGADQDQKILEEARSLMAQVDPQGATAGKFDIHNHFYGRVGNYVSGRDNMQVDMRKIYSREGTPDKEK